MSDDSLRPLESLEPVDPGQTDRDAGPREGRASRHGDRAEAVSSESLTASSQSRARTPGRSAGAVDPSASGSASKVSGNPAGSRAAKPASAKPAAPAPPRPSPPPARRSSGAAWLLLLATVLLAIPPLWIEIGRPEAVHPHELASVELSITTTLRQREIGDADRLFGDALVLYDHEGPRFDTAPGVHWLHRVLFQLWPPNDENPAADQLLLRARLVSAAAALLVVAAVFWAGHTLAEPRGAVIAGWIVAGCPLTLLFARLGGALMVELAAVTLAVAAGLWAIRPLRSAPRVERVFTGWVVCGLMIGFSLLVAGPLAPLAIVLPLAAAALLCPRRFGHAIGLIAALLIGVLLALPWAVYVQQHDPDAWAVVLPGSWTALKPTLSPEPPWAMLAFTLALLPWVPLLLAGLAQPISDSSHGARQRLFVGWIWFIAAALVVLFWDRHAHTVLPMPDWTRHGGEALLMLPPAGVLIGQAATHYKHLTYQARTARLWRWSRWPTLVLFLALAFGLPLAFARPAWISDAAGWLGLVDSGAHAIGDWTFDPPWLTNPGWAFWSGLGLALSLVAVFAAVFAFRHKPMRAAYLWALWGLIAATVLVLPFARSPRWRSPDRGQGLVLEQLARQTPLYDILGDQAGLTPSARFYSARLIRPILAAQVPDVAEPRGRVLLLVEPDLTLPVEHRRVTRLRGAPVEVVEVRSADAGADERRGPAPEAESDAEAEAAR